ncbi:class I SAM-dependent methyltransferase [Trueperella sp.]|uniref:class I SAM-dependent methyltransferase n=1 Tax=Trueperella sp. TaxID=2699835 RepID=UPI003736A225
MDISTLDELIVDVALGEVAQPRRVAVLDDPSGDLLRSVLGWQGVEAVLLGSRTIDQARGAQQAIGDDDRVSVAGADGPLRLDEFLAAPLDLAIGHVPKSLEETAYVAAAAAASGAVLVIGANNKHMDRGHNATLAEYYSDVRASRGRGKFRALISSGEPTGRTYAPAVGDSQAGPIFGVGGVFSGADEDYGGQFLAAEALKELTAETLSRKAAANPWDTWARPSEPERTDLDVVDLGCGNGSVALAVLDALPEAKVLATDTHADAVVSASLTLREFVDAGRARMTWDDAAGDEGDGVADVVLLNPPFHDGTAIDATLVQGLLDAGRRLLRPGGRLYMVHNNHLRYRPEVEARFDRVQQIARNSKFTVLRGQLAG